MLKKLRILSKIINIRNVEKAIDDITGISDINQENYGKILIATLEAVNNAIVHGNKSDEKKYVEIEILFKNKELIVKVKDQGNGFSPENVPDPTCPENLEAVNGRGVFLMKKLADEIKYNKKGNQVKMTFKNIRN